MYRLSLLQPALLQQRNWFQRTFLDWFVPWWVEPLLYLTVYGGWIVCWYFTLLYGVTFTYEEVRFCAWARPCPGHSLRGLACHP
jgi:hypothetical protein